MPATIPATIHILVRAIIPYTTTFGILDIAITITSDRIKLNMLIKIIHGMAFEKLGN